MTAASTLLHEARAPRRHVREGVLDEARGLPAESYDVRPAPGSRTVADLLRPIVARGRRMCGELTRCPRAEE